jgi:DNA-binding transcriptional LysR family regulator
MQIGGAVMHGFDWNDLRIFVSIAERGSLGAAARALGVNHTTIARRIQALEKRLGVRLLQRRATGYVLTENGEELRREMEPIQSAVANVERRLAGKDLRLTGSLRVSTTDTLAASILMPHVRDFREAHPDIALTLSVSNALVSLSRRDADVAIRPARSPADTLVGRRIARVGFAVYAATGSKLRVAPHDLARQAWIGLDDSLADTSVGQWLRTELREARIALRVDSFVAAREAAANGLGIAALPCYLGDNAAQLRRVTAPLPQLATELWILTHADLRKTARVSAFMGFIARGLGRERKTIEG